MVKFVVLTTQRSGSSFFCSALNNTQKIRCLQDYCRMPNRFPKRKTYTFGGWLANSQIKLSQLSADKRLLLVHQFLDTIMADSTDVQATGFKLMYLQLEQFQEVQTWLEQNSVRVIHLIRENLLKRLVSWMIKEKTELLTSTVKPLYQLRVCLECRDLVPLLTDMEAQVRAYRTHFSSQFSYLEVCYEDFVAFREGETDRLGHFLGIGSLGQLESDLVKINSDSLQDIVINYDAVADTLQNTPFERFLNKDYSASVLERI